MPVTPEVIKGRNIAVIQSLDQHVGIERIDGQAAKAGLSAEVEMTQGKHTVNVVVAPNNSKRVSSQYEFSLSAEAGHVYRISSRYNGIVSFFGSKEREGTRVWIIDVSSGTNVGEILESKNEPLTDDSREFHQSDSFIWMSPKEPGWFIISRSKGAMTLDHSGSNEDEGSTIAISVDSLPVLDSQSAFIEQIRKERRYQISDPDRITVLNDDFELYAGRGDYCVRSHRVVRNSNEVRLIWRYKFLKPQYDVKTDYYRPPLIDEDYGFDCRITKDRLHEVHFDYLRRSHEGQQDPGLKARAEESFSKLKF